MRLLSKKLCMVASLITPLCVAGAAHAVDGWATVNGNTTGGQGGSVAYASTGTEINQAMCQRAADDTPLTIYVSGTINHGNTTKVSGSCDTKDDAIQFKRVKNISLIGRGDGALFDEIGIHIREASNIIIRNIHVRNVKKSGSPISNGGDAIGLETDVDHIWIDHNELEASGGEKDGYDSLLDIKDHSQYITVSYNYMHHSGRGGLIGHSDSDDDNTFITFHHNRYENIDSRLPLLRHGTVHAYNNYYKGVSKSGMNPRAGGQIKAENNVFEDVQNPIGTFYTDDMGYWDISGNVFGSGVTWLSNDTNHPAGPNPYSTTSISIPYNYTPDPASCVKDEVIRTAGTGDDFPTSNCSDGGSSVHNTIVNGTYRIVPVHSGKAIDIASCGTEQGTNVQQWSWLNNDCQKFAISAVDGYWHRISPVNAPDLSLDVFEDSSEPGANIDAWTYWGGGMQQFRFQSAGSNRFRIINRDSGLCLDVYELSTDDGANLVQWTCIAGNQNQMFELVRQ